MLLHAPHVTKIKNWQGNFGKLEDSPNSPFIAAKVFYHTVFPLCKNQALVSVIIIQVHYLKLPLV